MAGLAPELKTENLLLALSSAGIGTWDYHPKTETVDWDDRCRTILGLAQDQSAAFKDALMLVHPEDRERVTRALKTALSDDKHGGVNLKYRIGAQDDLLRHVHVIGQVYFDGKGTANRLSGIILDITEEENAKAEIRKSEDLAQTVLESAEAGWLKLDMQTQALVFSPRLAYHITGEEKKDFSRADFIACIHAEDIHMRKKAFDVLDSTGKLSYASRMHWTNGEIHCISFEGKYQYDDAGVPQFLFAISRDITEEKETFRKLQASEAKFRSVVAAAPAAMGLFNGRDLVIEHPNQTFIDIVGKGDDIEGKRLVDVMPELLTENQPFLQILDDVYTSGKMFQSYASLVKIIRNGELTHNYYNISYSPVRDQDGKVFGVLDIAVDVTGEILVRKQLEANEKILQSAVEVAELAIWSIEFPSGIIHISEKLKSWLGLPEIVTIHDALAIVEPADRQRIQQAFENARADDQEGFFDEELTIIETAFCGKRIIHIQGRALTDPGAGAVTMAGIARDITAQRELQLALEEEVKQRTLELAGKNTELSESNTNLLRSNEELSQYAYVASHDLQEPLRKIRVYSSMLESKQEFTEAGKELLEKINNSAARMSLLINDLLNFSRLLNADSMWSIVNLNTVLRAVRKDFELIIEEKNAKIHLGELPVIEGVNFQLTQLFYNLMSNALKFSEGGKRPELTVISMPLSQAQSEKFTGKLPDGIVWHCISFSDNGIGFEKEYADKIFEIFKRLHGKHKFTGSGIGLALCKRIVSNHRGYIYADSKPGEGATFYIILPEKFPEPQQLLSPA